MRIFRPQPVLRPREQVEHQIREAIYAGTFIQGERLPAEAELARMLSVSRPTVREALRSLVAAGLVAKTTGASGGSFVQTLNHESLSTALYDSMEVILRLGSVDLAEIADVRTMLEVPAARLAAQHRTDEHLERLIRVVGHQKQITLEDPHVVALDMSFHSVIAEASGNRVLAAFIPALHQTTRPVRFLRLSPEVGQATISQHRAIIEAIRSGDPDQAGDAMRRHLEYLQRFSESGQNSASPGRVLPPPERTTADHVGGHR